MKKFCKIFMIFCVLFSQFNGVLSVFAEEIDTGVLEEEDVLIDVTLDSDYNLHVSGDGNLNDESSYDIYISSYFEYDYDNSIKVGYNNEKINGEESISGSVLNLDGYSSVINSIETLYNGIFNVEVTVIDTVNDDSYSDSFEIVINNTDEFSVYANLELVDNTYIVDSDNLLVDYTYDYKLFSTKEDVVSSIFVNDTNILDKYSVLYDGMLYGEYLYKWDIMVDSNIYNTKDISVLYNSEELDNDSANDVILTDSNDLGLVYLEGNLYVMGSLTYLDFINSINLEGYDFNVLDRDSNIIDSEDVLSNGMTLEISGNALASSIIYDIVIVGDVNSDLVVDNNDVLEMVNSILDEENEEDYYNASADINRDSNVDIFDVTKLMDSIENGFDNSVVVDSLNKLNPVISSDVADEIKIGDTFTVRFSLNNFNQSMINGLSGIVDYDENILRLDSFYVNGMEMHSNSLSEFILLGNYNSEDTLIELTFTAIGASDDEYISISDLLASYCGEEIFLSSSSVSINFAITFSQNVGGDVLDEEEVEEVVEEAKPVVLVNNSYVLSSDSYLLDLEVEGHEIDFSPYTFKYNISVDSSVSSLNLNVVLSDSRASYEIFGNEDFKVGENIVTIVVTAEDGNTHTYTLVVDKEDEEVDKDKKADVKVDEDSNVSRVIIIILVIMVIIGLVYLIFKDDDEDNKSKKEKKD